MNIYEAATKAGKTTNYMTRRSWRTAVIEVIEPGTFYSHDVIPAFAFPAEMRCYGKRWAPEPADILADDWEVVERPAITEPVKEPPAQTKPQSKTTSTLRIVTLCMAVLSMALSLISILLK